MMVELCQVKHAWLYCAKLDICYDSMSCGS